VVWSSWVDEHVEGDVAAVVAVAAAAASEEDCAYGGGTASGLASGRSPFRHSSRVFDEPKKSS
jgi:hypothetical protein